jgi:signal transduction histidine kinase/CheY-like chemotaxis protein
MNEIKSPTSGSGKTPVSRYNSTEEELGFLRQQVAELEGQNQQLYQNWFLLQQRLSTSNLNERERLEFISHVAHELRTPLTSIKGYVDLVMEGETGPITELQREFLSVVGLNAEKLAHIISDLLDISRLEARQLSFRPVVVDFRTLILNISAQVRPQLEAKGTKLEVNAPNGGPLTASLDPERFSQAIRAIIAHAGQVTPQGKTVKVTIEADPTESNAIIRVEDQGPGIEAEDLERVFTKFWRPQNQAWGEGAGAGLGLAIAKNIIDAHEGQARVENQPPEIGGSIITVTMPLLSRALGLDSIPEEEPEEAPHYAALVITQNPDFGKVIEQTLGKVGFQVIIASDRSELMAESPAWQPDLIINNGAEPELLNEEESQKVGSTLRGAATLTLNLSPVEQRVIVAGAKAVLPWPAPEKLITQHLGLVITPSDSSVDPEEFLAQQTILLVSPSSDNLRSLDRLVREAGFVKIYRAMREADALTLARRYKPDWLLLDVPGPVEGGNDEPTLFEMLREDQLLIKTPTIVFLHPDLIAPDPSPDYRPTFTGKDLRRITTDELKARRRGTGELRGRPRSSGEEGSRGGGLRSNGTDELKGLYYNVVPKPFIQQRLVTVARRLCSLR